VINEDASMHLALNSPSFTICLRLRIKFLGAFDGIICYPSSGIVRGVSFSNEVSKTTLGSSTT